MRRARILTIPVALNIDALRDALHAAHLPATVKPLGRDGIKVTPGTGAAWPLVEAFINGFKAGFNS